MKIGKIFTPSVRFPLLRKGNRCLIPPAGGGNLQEGGQKTDPQKSYPILPQIGGRGLFEHLSGVSM